MTGVNGQKYGKTIELFLVNGDSDGIVTAELSNWNGKAIKIPSIMVKDSKREDIKLPGVYFCSVKISVFILARLRMCKTGFVSI